MVCHGEKKNVIIVKIYHFQAPAVDAFRYILLEFNTCIFLSSGDEIIFYKLIPTILLKLNIS